MKLIRWGIRHFPVVSCGPGLGGRWPVAKQASEIDDTSPYVTRAVFDIKSDKLRQPF